MNKQTPAGSTAASRTPAAPLPTLTVLRQRTRAAHTRLDSSIDLSAHLRSRSSYARFLLRYLDIYRPLEARLFAAPLTPFLAQTYTGKVDILKRDLRALGWDPSLLQPSSDYVFPDFDNLDNLLGALYVIQGSALGGQIIYRQIEQQLHLDSTNGAAFFFGSGEQTSVVWKRYTSLLEQHASDANQVADAAVMMFAAFEQALLASTPIETARMP